jgi:hypothetical protein
MDATTPEKDKTAPAPRDLALPPADLVSQMLAPGLAEPPTPGRRRASARDGYAAGLKLALRRMPPGWRRSFSA